MVNNELLNDSIAALSELLALLRTIDVDLYCINCESVMHKAESVISDYAQLVI